MDSIQVQAVRGALYDTAVIHAKKDVDDLAEELIKTAFALEEKYGSEIVHSALLRFTKELNALGTFISIQDLPLPGFLKRLLLYGIVLRYDGKLRAATASLERRI